MKKLIALGLGLALADGALAQFGMGMSAGVSYTPVECLSGSHCQDTDLGVKLYGGVALNSALALELGYIDFGKATADTRSFGVELHDKIGARALTLALALRAPLGADWHGVARVGAASVDAWETHSLLLPDRRKTTTNAYLGLGLEYAFTQQLRAAFMLDTTTGDTGATSGSIFLLSAGLQFGF